MKFKSFIINTNVNAAGVYSVTVFRRIFNSSTQFNFHCPHTRVPYIDILWCPQNVYTWIIWWDASIRIWCNIEEDTWWEIYELTQLYNKIIIWNISLTGWAIFAVDQQVICQKLGKIPIKYTWITVWIFT